MARQDARRAVSQNRVSMTILGSLAVESVAQAAFLPGGSQKGTKPSVKTAETKRVVAGDPVVSMIGTVSLGQHLGPNSNEFRDHPPSVLVVDDDPGLAEALVWGLKDRGISVRAATTGAEARRMASEPFDFVILDFMLPDATGLDIAECYTGTPFVLISGFLQTRTTVRAMQLGAVDVLEKPIDLAALTSLITGVLEHRQPATSADGRAASRVAPASSKPVALAWAESVVRASTSPRDLATVTAWARHVGVSRSTLAEQSRILGLSARAGRDLARGLRAVVRASREGCAPASLLDVRDRRTLTALLSRMGFEDGGIETVPVAQFLAQQHLVPQTSDALDAVRRVVKSMVV